MYGARNFYDGVISMGVLRFLATVVVAVILIAIIVYVVRIIL